MNKRYWVHKPIKGDDMEEIYDSSDFWSVTLLWFFAKIIGIAIILGIFFLFSLLA